MRPVPRLIQPPDMSREVQEIIEALGIATRVHVLRALALHGPATAPELARELNADRAGLHQHLRNLEEAGLVHADLPPEERRGRTVRWSADPQRVAAAVRKLGDYLAGR